MDVLLDTPVWAWMLTNDPRLTVAAIQAAETADAVRLSPMSFFEVAQMTRMGKWPDMADFVDQLPDLAEAQGILTAPVTPEIAVYAGHMAWDHHDIFDRMIAATAAKTGSVLLSADTIFDTLADGGVQRLW